MLVECIQNFYFYIYTVLVLIYTLQPIYYLCHLSIPGGGKQMALSMYFCKTSWEGVYICKGCSKKKEEYAKDHLAHKASNTYSTIWPFTVKVSWSTSRVGIFFSVKVQTINILSTKVSFPSKSMGNKWSVIFQRGKRAREMLTEVV